MAKRRRRSRADAGSALIASAMAIRLLITVVFKGGASFNEKWNVGIIDGLAMSAILLGVGVGALAWMGLPTVWWWIMFWLAEIWAGLWMLFWAYRSLRRLG